MTVHIIPGRAYDSNIFIITGSEPTIIDTGTGQNRTHVHNEIRKYVDPLIITQIIFTHEHFDHTGGAKAIFDLTEQQTRIISHPYAKEKVEQGTSMFARMLGATMPKIKVNTTIDDGDTIQIGDDNFNVINTPGHTPGCICLYCIETKTLFSGDTVFSHGSFGRTDFPGGSTNQLIASIKRLTQLDIENLYPGHEAVIQGGGNNHIALSFQSINSLY